MDQNQQSESVDPVGMQIQPEIALYLSPKCNQSLVRNKKLQKFMELQRLYPSVSFIDKKLHLKQNSLNQIKKYSRALDSPILISAVSKQKDKIPSYKSNRYHRQQEISSSINQSLVKDIQKSYNHYSSKNERKNKIIMRAKQLGRNNFYRFLKGSSIIQSNKHMHRFHFRQHYRLPEETGDTSTQMSPVIMSYEPFYQSVRIEELIKQQEKQKVKPGKIQLPNLKQNEKRKDYIKQNIRMKSEQAIKSHELILTKDNSFSQILNEQKKPRKHIARSLTQINQQIRRNRKEKNSTLLFLKSKDDKKSPDQLHFERWKYRSLFDQTILDQKKDKEPIFKQDLPFLDKLLAEDKKQKIIKRSTLQKSLKFSTVQSKPKHIFKGQVLSDQIKEQSRPAQKISKQGKIQRRQNFKQQIASYNSIAQKINAIHAEQMDAIKLLKGRNFQIQI